MTEKTHFAVATFDRQPIRTFARMAQVQRHNSREESLPHVIPSAPAPVHLLGRGDLVSDFRYRLRECGIQSIRKNAVLAREIVFTSDHSYFETGNHEADSQRLWDWARATVTFAIRHWGAAPLISAVLHRDEHTPHLHVVIAPLIRKALKRWPARGRIWRLEDRSLSAPGRWQQMHTAYAEAMHTLGLERGVSGSNAKKRPYGDLLVELKEREETAARERALASDAFAHAQRSKEAAELDALELRQERDRLVRIKMKLTEKEASLQALTAFAVDERRAWEEVARPLTTAINFGVDLMRATRGLSVESLPRPVLDVLFRFREFKAQIAQLPVERLPATDPSLVAQYRWMRDRAEGHRQT